MEKPHPNAKAKLRVANRNDSYQITPERLTAAARFLAAYLEDDQGLAISRSLIKAARHLLGVYGSREKIWHLPADYHERLVEAGINPETWFIVDRRRLARAWQQLLETGRVDLELLKKQNSDNYEAPEMENLAVKTAPFTRIAGGKAQIVGSPPKVEEKSHLQRQIFNHFFDPLEE